jgi:TIR domain/SIR2-like domain
MTVSTIGAMREGDWASLTSSVDSGRCILMLGPGAFMAEFEGEVLPVAVGLARFIKERLGDEWAFLDPNKPWSVAQVAVAQEDPNTLRAWVHEFYDTHNTESEALNTLASLPFQLIINTSPGFSAARAFTSLKSKTYVDFYDRTAPARIYLPDPSRDAPVVYGLYGSLQQPSSMILSENDRFDFLISIITETPPLPQKLTSALCDPRQSFLFLGFNLAQWQLRMLVYVVLRKVQRENKSYALELEDEDIDADAILFYTGGHKVHFVDTDLTTLTNELRARVHEQADVAGNGERNHAVPDRDAPTAFLCHAHEDAEFARRLAEQLRGNGINVWLDKDNLRGGDHWDEQIERVLENEVQYVVILQSASLKAKEVGYVNKEINLAIERQSYYRAPRIFVIPTVIDRPDSNLVELEKIQFIDLSVSEGVNDLVKTIRRDLDAASRAR